MQCEARKQNRKSRTLMYGEFRFVLRNEAMRRLRRNGYLAITSTMPRVLERPSKSILRVVRNFTTPVLSAKSV